MRQGLMIFLLVSGMVLTHSACGSTPKPPEPTPLPPPEPVDNSPVPYEEAFPEDFKLRVPLRIGVVSSPNQPDMGKRVAAVIGNFQKRRLEKALGVRIVIAYVSKSQKLHGTKTVIQYRPEFMKAAIQVASVLPKGQELRPMGADELRRTGVDMLVHLGDKLK